MRIHLSAVTLIALLAGVGLAGCTSQAQTTPTPAVQTITATLTDTTVTALQIAIRPGVPCHFLVTNRGTRPHQFWLMPQGMAQLMNQMPMAQWHQRLPYSTPDIGPGMMTTFDYTFSMPMMQQALAFGCYDANGQSVFEMPIHVSS